MKEYTSYFIGIPLPQKYEDEFGDLLKDIKKIDASLETVDPKTPHITVYYLNKQSQAVLPEIVDVVNGHITMLDGVRLQVSNLGFFRPGDPRVMFLDVKYPDVLSTFNEFVTQDLPRFAADNNNLPFHPHMTVAKMRTDIAQNVFAQKKAALKDRLSKVLWNFPVTELAIYGVDSAQRPEYQEKLSIIPV